ncbi:cytochrome oxidase [Escherichia coli]|nr:cytochrome oxidase [Escherichia coli]
MLDRHLHPRIKPLLHQCVRVLDKPGITPDGLTLVGFAIGVLALPFLALGWYLAALVVILLNRLLDGLDGALARRRELTDAGGFLDISLDFLFYALVPFGFILAAPEQNALAAAGCCLRLSARAAVFSPLLHWQQNIRLITRLCT